MIRKFLLFILLTLPVGATVNAIPAYPFKKVVTKPDGTHVTLTLRGDEHFSFYTDEDQNTYRYVDGNYVVTNPDEIYARWTSLSATANKARTKRHARARRTGEPKPGLKGKKKGLVILMAFLDQDFSIDNPKATYEDFFNKPGYSDYGMSGSVKDYFLQQSYGQLEIDFDVAGPYTSFHNMSWYGKPNGNQNDTAPEELMKEACRRADDDVDFSKYDWDGDGEVEQIFVIYAGYGQNYGADENTIWPHEWSFSASGSTLTQDDVVLNTYACSCELRGISGTNLDGIGAACHEFSHCLGLPDFYDTQGNNYGMGNWDVMDNGAYNNDSKTPAGYTSYERIFAGWMEPSELSTMTRIEDMKPLADTPEAYILYNEGHRDEYYLLENRQPVKFDDGLPGHGLLVIHVDYNEQAWSTNTVNVAGSRQLCTIIPADGTTSRANQKGDPFPGSKGVTELTNYSSPAAILYNENTDGSKLMNKPIDNIKESDDGLISFVACRPELGIPEPGEGTAPEGKNEFTVTWPAVSGAIGYELELTEIGRASDNPAEALKGEYKFENVESKTAGLSDISSKMADYGLSGWSGEKLYTSPNRLRIGTSSTTGFLKSPTWNVPQSSEMTIVIGAKPYKEGTPVKGQVRVAFGNAGDLPTYETLPFQLTEEGMMLFHVSIRKDLFWLEVRPETCMYLNYLAIYDGSWSEEQLGIAKQNASRAMTPKKASTITNYTTDTNSYTFKGLNTRSRFFYRVRALGEENTYSQWSEEKSFTFTGDFDVPEGDVNGDGNVDSKDIVDMVSFMMGHEPAIFDSDAADINKDGKVDIADILQITNIILQRK